MIRLRMKLDEITDRNRSQAILRGIPLNIDNSFDDAKELLNIMIRLKSTYRNNMLMPSVISYENDLRRFIDEQFEDDVDIDELKVKAAKILIEIDNLKQQL